MLPREMHGALLRAAASLEEIRMNPDFVPYYYYFLIIKVTPYGPLTTWRSERAWENPSGMLETVAVFPSLNCSQEVDYASNFFFSIFKRIPATKGRFRHRAIPCLFPTSFPSTPFLLPISQIHSLPVQPA